MSYQQGHAVVMERAEGKKAQEETSFTRNRRVKLETPFSKMNGTTSPSLTDDKAGVHCTRLKQPALLYMSCVKAVRRTCFLHSVQLCFYHCTLSLKLRDLDLDLNLLFEIQA